MSVSYFPGVWHEVVSINGILNSTTVYNNETLSRHEEYKSTLHLKLILNVHFKHWSQRESKLQTGTQYENLRNLVNRICV